MRKMYFQSHKDQILDLIKEIKDRVKTMERNIGQPGMPKAMNKGYIRKFFARCNMIKARLYANLEEESEALNFIQMALTHLQENDKPLKKKATRRTSLQDVK